MSKLKTVSVTASMADGYTINADIRGHKVVIDQPENAKGANEGPTPLEQFLFAMAGCVGTIARTAAFQQRINLRGMQVSVSGDLNPAGLLGKPTDDRIGFNEIRIEATIDADLDDAQKAEFLDQVCQRCPLHDNISMASKVVHQLTAVPNEG
ncbi:MAG: OsmC family protein [Halopseudomonas sp.]